MVRKFQSEERRLWEKEFAEGSEGVSEKLIFESEAKNALEAA